MIILNKLFFYFTELPPKPKFLELTASDVIGEMIADVGRVEEDVEGYEMILEPQSNCE